jgi:hypothetical protein
MRKTSPRVGVAETTGTSEASKDSREVFQDEPEKGNRQRFDLSQTVPMRDSCFSDTRTTTRPSGSCPSTCLLRVDFGPGFVHNATTTVVAGVASSNVAGQVAKRFASA